MNNSFRHLRSRLLVAGISLAAIAGANSVSAAEAGRVLFASGDVRIIAPDGSSRAAKRGDIVQHGERIQTGQGALGQVQMIDGERVGVRGGSKVLFSPPPAGAAQPRQIELESGRVRVLNVADRGKPATKPVEIKTPDGELLMDSADVVVGFVRDSGAAGQTGNAAPTTRKVRAQINRGKVQASRGAQRLAMVAGQAAELSQGTIQRVASRLNDLEPPAPRQTQLRPSDTSENQRLGKSASPKGPIVKPGSFATIPQARPAVPRVGLARTPLRQPFSLPTPPRLPIVPATQLAISVGDTQPTFKISQTSGTDEPTFSTLLSTTRLLSTSTLDSTSKLTTDTTSPTLSSLSTTSLDSTFTLSTKTITEPLSTTDSKTESEVLIDSSKLFSRSTTTTTRLKCTTDRLGRTTCTK